ncbi:MAG: arsinothricin resistance N-acetyltransferase ArsN1 family B [Candidatus Eisenbacteria bacterium]
MSALVIRPARETDAAALLAIYAPFVATTAVSFEETVPTPDEFAARIRTAQERWAWLAAESGGAVVGYAYAGAHRARAAYRHSVEVSAYVAPEARRRGVARALYAELFARLAELGYCNAYAGIALPNDASLALHRALGFADVGVFRRVGRKFGRWHDVAWLHRVLRDAPARD